VAKGTGLRNAPSLDFRTDGYLLTGDVNIIHLKLRARYQVRSDPEGAIAYAFDVEDPEGVLRRALKAATCKVVGTMRVEQVLERDALFSRIRLELDERLRRFEQRTGRPVGVTVNAVEAIQTEKTKNPSEPGVVSEAFFEAQNAYSLKDQLEQEGKTEKTKILNDAHAQAAEISAEAQGYKERLVRSAQADAESLQRLLPVYNHSPEVRRILVDRYYQRAVEEVAQKSPGFFVLHQGEDGTQRELRLMLNRVPEEAKGEERRRDFTRITPED
jgi:membrane protease subunit HflK